MIKSFLGTSLIEYPGKISCVIFIGGCNLRCPFCYNPDLVLPELVKKLPDISQDEVIKKLKERTGFIEGVSFTGGEPLLAPRLISFLKRIKEEVGVKVKIDTNGTLPEKLKSALPFIDYISMDIKSSPEKYPIATGNNTEFKQVEESIKIIKSTENYEFRTTMVPGIVEKDDIKKICEKIGSVRKYVLQGFKNRKTLSPEFSGVSPYPEKYLKEASLELKDCAGVVEIRE